MGVEALSALLHLFNQIHAEHVMPSFWLEAEITSIPKPHDPSSSRPISLIKVFSKVMDHMAKARPFHRRVFGYFSRVGTSEAIATTISDISDVLFNNKQSAAIIIFLDHTKAFESLRGGHSRTTPQQRY